MAQYAFELGDSVTDDKGERASFASDLQDVPPPVVLAVQPSSFVRLESSEALRSWEKAVRATTGLDVKGDQFVGSASESCSAGCTDDCDIC